MDNLGVDEKICREIVLLSPESEEFEIIEWQLKYRNDLVGFHGEHALLKIDYKVGDVSRTLKLFYKGAVGMKAGFEAYLSIVRVFEREHYMLTMVLRKLQKMVKRQLTARCYYSQLNRFIITEDLSEVGFEVQRVQQTDFDHAVVALDQLAALHAASFIAEARSNKSAIELFPQMDFETLFNDKRGETGVILRTSGNILRFLFKNKLTDIPVKDVEHFLDWFADTISNSVKQSSKFRNCILHGDPWGGNILFRYNEEGNPKEAILLDFQLSRISPPAIDFLMYVALQFGPMEVRRLLSPLSAGYFASLRSRLTEAGLNPDHFMTQLDFQRSLIAFAPFAACIRVQFLPFAMLPKEVVQRTLKSSEAYIKFMTQGDIESVAQAFDTVPQFRAVVTEAIQEACHIYFNNKNLKIN